MNDPRSSDPEPQPLPEQRALRHAPPQSMTDVVGRAAELQGLAERSQDERAAALAAAQELGIDSGYLDRAAGELQRERIDQVRAQRRQRRMVLGLLGGSVLAGLGAAAGLWRWQSGKASPVVYSFDNEQDRPWRLQKNPLSQAALSYPQDGDRGVVASVRVDRFANEPDGSEYFVNFDTAENPRNLEDYRQLSFDVRGNGLATLRVYLENIVESERYRSVPFQVTNAWQTYTVRFDTGMLERQTRTGRDWRVVQWKPVATITRISFKLGGFINDIASTGEIRIANVRIE